MPHKIAIPIGYVRIFMNSVKRSVSVSILLAMATVSSQLPTAGGQGKESQNSAISSSVQSTTSSTKVKIHRGGIDDIDAIGKRKLYKETIFYSETREIEIGRQLAQKLEQSQTLLLDPEVTEYVNRIGQNLVVNSDAKGPLTIKVLQSNEVNCSALPGGFLYVTTGLIAATANEAELAGVLAQGIAHIAARHAARTATRTDIEGIRSVPWGYLGDHESGFDTPQAKKAMAKAFAHSSREFTQEADYLAVQYMYKAGYDPEGFVTFLGKLQDREQSLPASTLAGDTDPPAAVRIQSAQKEIARILPARDHSILNTPEFERIQGHLRMLPTT